MITEKEEEENEAEKKVKKVQNVFFVVYKGLLCTSVNSRILSH